MKDNSSNLALRFLRWFCPIELLESIEGDILEQFEADVEAVGLRIARRRIILNVLKFFHPQILLKNKFSIKIIDTIMLSNYLTIAYRNVIKNKVFSAINIFGLAIGLAVCLFIFQFVGFELSYDTFNEKYKRTYRVTNDRFQNGKLIQHGTITYPTIGSTMAKDYPEIEEYTRLMPGGNLNVRIGDKYFRGDRCHFVDEHFLSVFSFPLLAGERSSALKEPYSIVLSETTALKYFDVKDKDYANLVGKVLYWGRDPQPYRVNAICADIPENSHIQFDALVSYATLVKNEPSADNSWTWSDMRHYLVLKRGADYKALENKFEAFSGRYFEGNKVSGSIEKFYLQPLEDAHLFSDYEYDIAKVASGKAVWAMMVVAGFILLIAWINYINLTTSRALERAKEVGLRKVMGALKGQLIKQFIFESVLISFVAFAIALVLVQLLQKPFNQIIGSNLSWSTIFSTIDTTTIFIFIGVLIGGAILSGFYPAFVLSAYQPVTVLKGKFRHSMHGQFLRKGLVVFQFTTSVVLITGTLIVSKQLKYMNDADLGINIQSTMIIQSPQLTDWDSTTIERIENYKHALTQIKGVVSAATSGNLPGDRLGRAFGIRLSEHSSEAKYTMSMMQIDYNFFDTYSVSVIAGRKFIASDHKYNYRDIKDIVINSSAVRLLGIENPENAIGKEIVWGNNGQRKWNIVGVVSDYHQESLKNPKEPMLFRPTYSTYHPTSVKFENVDPQNIIAQIENVYKKFFPDNPFQYSFLEDQYKAQYRDDNRFGMVIRTFTILGIIISSLGLIGLSSYTAYQRTKEIGIRKVLGATQVSLVSLLSIDFIKLVLIASILAVPIAFFSMKNWLTGYAYRISLEWMFFLVPVFLIVLIAAVTMSFYVLKTARTNPADTLKYE